MTALAFQGNGLPVSSTGLAQVCTSLGVHAPEIWTVLATETAASGFLTDRRPDILYERHIFHRLTGGKFDDGDISDPSPGGYGAGGAHQYDRLNAAIAKDREAALQSASWGIGQVMGENFHAAGFSDVESMVAAMVQSEDNQLNAMAGYLSSNGLQMSLQTHDWKSFARGYNGVNYAINHYDTRLLGNYQKYSSGSLPDLVVRAAQTYLGYLGFPPGGIDGVAGMRTLSALADFQNQAGLPLTGAITDDAVTQLLNAVTGS